MRFGSLALSLLLLAACRPSPAPVTPRAPATVEEAPAPVRRAAPEAPRVVPLEEDPTPDGEACVASASCEDGQHCRGPAGCTQAWACGAPRTCGEVEVAYCGCDAATFYAPEGCPGQPYQHVGPCEALGELLTEAPEPVEGSRICQSNEDCRRGFVCAGAPGCGTLWTCQRPWRQRPRCRFRRAEWCGCNGETFRARSTCPGRPVLHAGACDASDEALAITGASEAAPAASAPPGPAPRRGRALTSPHAPARPRGLASQLAPP